jgi:hypothetical protein
MTNFLHRNCKILQLKINISKSHRQSQCTLQLTCESHIQTKIQTALYRQQFRITHMVIWIFLISFLTETKIITSQWLISPLESPCILCSANQNEVRFISAEGKPAMTLHIPMLRNSVMFILRSRSKPALLTHSFPSQNGRKKNFCFRVKGSNVLISGSQNASSISPRHNPRKRTIKKTKRARGLSRCRRWILLCFNMR